MSDGQCNVIFSSLPNGKTKVSEVCLVTLLKPVQGSKKKMKIDTTGFGTISRGPKGLRSDDASSSSQLNSKQKRMQIQQHRDYLKKKQQKKQNRIKELEEEREKEKSKWQQFNQKVSFDFSNLSIRSHLFRSFGSYEYNFIIIYYQMIHLFPMMQTHKKIKLKISSCLIYPSSFQMI